MSPVLHPALTIGEHTIQRIVEQEAPFFDMLEFFPSLGRAGLDANRSWLEPNYVDPATGRVVLCIQSYVVRTRNRTILIDTCVGNHKPRPSRAFWNQMSSDRYEKGLAALGLGVGDIDIVMCTHLHVDHTGWNTRLENGRWVPTFPNARYLFADRELAFWTKRNAEKPETCPWVTDSVLPIVAAGRCDAVRSDHALDDHIHLMPTPGHTIDHFAVRVGRTNQDAIICGDMVHSPIQVRMPELGMFSDYDSRQSGETRRRVFTEIGETPTLLCTGHFPGQSIGHIKRRADTFDFAPLR